MLIETNGLGIVGRGQDTGDGGVSGVGTVLLERDACHKGVVVVVGGLCLTSSQVTRGDHNGRAAGRQLTLEKGVDNNDRRQVEGVVAKGKGIIEMQLSLVDTSDTSQTARHCRIAETHINIGEVHGLMSSVNVEEDNLAAVNNSLVLGDDHLVLNEPIRLRQCRLEVNRSLGNVVTIKVGWEFDVADGSVDKSGSCNSTKVGVAQTSSVGERGDLSEGWAEREDSQQFSQHGTLIVNLEQIGAIEICPVIRGQNSVETGDAVINIEAVTLRVELALTKG